MTSNYGKYGYSKIFVAHPDVQVIREILTTLFGSRFVLGSLERSGLAVDVRRNADSVETAGAATDFVQWSVLVELEAINDGDERAIVETTAKMLGELWGAGYSAVAACDFEDELPWAGGIHRPSPEDRNLTATDDPHLTRFREYR